MLDLELFSDPVLEIDRNFSITNTNSIFNQFYDISKRKVLNKKVSDLFELSKEFYENEIPNNMLVSKQLGILFGTNLNQNVQFFKTKHPDYEGHSLLHLKDVDAEVRLHNKNLRQIRGEEIESKIENHQILAEILDHEHCAVFKVSKNNIECLHFHILPDLKERNLESFVDYLNENMKPKADWANFFKILNMNSIDLSDIRDLIPDRLQYKNRTLTLSLLPIHQEESVVLLFKDISEEDKDKNVQENQRVLSHFYSLYIKRPTLLQLFISEIDFLISEKNMQNIDHTLHSLKGLLYLIGLKKFAEDVHILEFLTEEKYQSQGFKTLKKQIKTFLDQNTNQSSHIVVDQVLLEAYKIPHGKYVSLDSMIQNIDELIRFYLEFLSDKYKNVSKLDDLFFIPKKVASSLLTIFNHLIRNVGAHGDETSFKLNIEIKNKKLIIETENIIKEKRLTKIAFLSGRDLGVSIVENLCQENKIFFTHYIKDNIFYNQLKLSLLCKEDLNE